MLQAKIALKISITPYMGIRFLAINFLSNRAEISYGNSGEYYPSIGGENSCFWCFFERNTIFGGKMGVATTVAPRGLGPQDPTKNLALWVDILRLETVVSKTCFESLPTP